MKLLWTLVGLTAALFTSTSLLPQLFALLRDPGKAHMSYATLGVFAMGVVLWAVYGIHLGDPIIVCANLFVLANVAVITWLQWRHEQKKRHPEHH